MNLIEVKSQESKVKSTGQKLKVDIRERAYRFAIDIIKLVDVLEKSTSSKVMANQLLRCATSIGANLIEAKASASRKDFTNFYTIALKSANETKFWLGLLKDTDKIPFDKAQYLNREINEIANIIASCILSLKGKRDNV